MHRFLLRITIETIRVETEPQTGRNREGNPIVQIRRTKKTNKKI